jgi:hypothetical protein
MHRKISYISQSRLLLSILTLKLAFKKYGSLLCQQNQDCKPVTIAVWPMRQTALTI